MLPRLVGYVSVINAIFPLHFVLFCPLLCGALLSVFVSVCDSGLWGCCTCVCWRGEQWKGKGQEGGWCGSGRVWTAAIWVPSGIDFHAKAHLIHMALKPRPLSFQPTKTHTNGQRANSSLMLSGALFFFLPRCVHVCLPWTCTLFTHVVIILWIFSERQIVKCQIRLFAVLQGPDWGSSASPCVCGERFQLLIVPFQLALKWNDQTAFV